MRKRLQHKAKPQAGEGEHETANKQIGADTPSPPQVPEHPNATEGSRDETAKSHWTDQRWQTILMGLILFVTAVYSVVSILQWQAMEKSIRQTDDTRRVQDRAYLTVKGANLQRFTVGTTVIIAVDLENSGHTPAGEVRLVVKAYETDTLKPRRYVFVDSDFPKAFTNVGPNVTVQHAELSDYVLTDEHKGALDTGKSFLFVEGEVRYFDVFKQLHRTTFCLFYKPPYLELEDCGGTSD